MTRRNKYIKVGFEEVVQVYRKCSKCGEAHELSAGYHRGKTNRCGHIPVCRACSSRSGVIQSPEEASAVKTYIRVDFEEVVEIYRPCTKCGEAHELSVGYSRHKNQRYGHATVCKACEAAVAAAWAKANPDRNASSAANRRAVKLERTPFWVTRAHKREMASRFTEARKLKEETGVVYHVDHIVPMQGEFVCGLHVPWNLQVITATENFQKHNNFKLWDED